MQIIKMIFTLFLQNLIISDLNDNSQDVRYQRLTKEEKLKQEIEQMQIQQQLLENKLAEQKEKLKSSIEQKTNLQIQLTDLDVQIQDQEVSLNKTKLQTMQDQSILENVKKDNEQLQQIKDQLYNTFQNLLNNKSSEQIINLKKVTYNKEIQINNLKNTIVHHRAYFENYQQQIQQNNEDLIPLRKQSSDFVYKLLQLKRENAKYRAFMPEIEKIQKNFKQFFYENFSMEIEMRPVRLENRKKWIQQEKFKIKDSIREEDQVQFEIKSLKQQFEELESLKQSINTERQLNLQLRSQQIDAYLKQRIISQQKMKDNEKHSEDLDSFIKKIKNSLICKNLENNQFNQYILKLIQQSIYAVTQSKISQILFFYLVIYYNIWYSYLTFYITLEYIIDRL